MKDLIPQQNVQKIFHLERRTQTKAMRSQGLASSNKI
jgi:hypothetical protein